MPIPSPVDDRYRPSRISSRFEIPGPESDDRHFQPLRRLQFQRKRDLAIACIAERIPRHLRGRSRESYLVLIVQAQFRGHFACPLPRLHHITFGCQCDTKIGSDIGSRSLYHDNACIIALSSEIAKQCSADHRGMTCDQTRIR